MKITLTVILLLALFVILSPTYGQWQKHIIEDDMSTTVSVDVADMDGDSKPDLLVTNGGRNQIILYLNEFPQWNKTIIDNVMAPFAYTGDIDGDDTLDVVACHYMANDIVWYENNYPTWTKHMIDENTNWADYIIVVDLDNDDKLDVVTAVTTSYYNHIGDIVWYENNHPDWTKHIIESDINGTAFLNVTDIDGDGILDLLATHDGAHKVILYKTEDNGLSWTKYTIDDNLQYAWGLNSGDIDGDDTMDVVATTGGPYFNGSDVVWYENNHPTWTKHVIDTNLPGANNIEVNDVDGDGKMDVISEGFVSDDVVWYENPTWTKHIIDANLDGPRVFALADLDEDGSNDLIVPGKNNVVWYKNPYNLVDVNDYWTCINDTLKHASTIAFNSNDDIFAATWDRGVFRSTDNGDNWAQINNGLTNLLIRSLAINSNSHIFAIADSGIFRSIDNGDNWTQINNGLSDSIIIECLEINSNDHIFIGTDAGLFRTTNDGDNWTQIDNGFPDLYVGSLAISSNDHIFAGTGDGVFRSIDNGDNWTKIRSDFFNEKVGPIDFNSNGDIFVVTYFSDILRSTDNGDTWTQINNGLPNSAVTSIVINSEDHIFTAVGCAPYGGPDGVFKTINNAESWTPINYGLIDSCVLSLGINSEEYLFACTLDGGIYRSQNSTIISVEQINSIPHTYMLSQNYPNPFNPTTTIKYSIPYSSVIPNSVRDLSTQIPDQARNDNVILKVYDILGREVATLVNQKQNPGIYEITWDAKNKPSGVYFYQLHTGDFRETKKMILLQ